MIPRPPTVNSLSITSTGAPYSEGETIQVTVRFSETVQVQLTGTPQVTLKIDSGEKKANYTTGSNTANLVFEYTVVSGDNDTDGISIATNSLALNSGTIKDAANNDATLTHTALPAQPLHKVDTTKPIVDTVAITSYPRNNGTYKTDETIRATVTF